MRTASAVPSATSRWPTSLLQLKMMARSCVGSVVPVRTHPAARAVIKSSCLVCDSTHSSVITVSSLANVSSFAVFLQASQWPLCFSSGSQNVEYKHKVWHEECFICFECKQPIRSQSFLTKGDEFYCGACHEKKFAKNCARCKEVTAASKE